MALVPVQAAWVLPTGRWYGLFNNALHYPAYNGYHFRRITLPSDDGILLEPGPSAVQGSEFYSIRQAVEFSECETIGCIVTSLPWKRIV
jgi:hypothetical protein